MGRKNAAKKLTTRIDREAAMRNWKSPKHAPFPPPELAEQGVYCDDSCHKIEAVWKRPKDELMPPKSSVEPRVEVPIWRRSEISTAEGEVRAEPRPKKSRPAAEFRPAENGTSARESCSCEKIEPQSAAKVCGRQNRHPTNSSAKKSPRARTEGNANHGANYVLSKQFARRCLKKWIAIPPWS